MYKIIKNGDEEYIQNEDGAHIPRSDDNRHYRAYKEYLKKNKIKEKHLEIEDITPEKNNRVQVMYDVSLGKLVYHNGKDWQIVP